MEAAAVTVVIRQAAVVVRVVIARQQDTQLLPHRMESPWVEVVPGQALLPWHRMAMILFLAQSHQAVAVVQVTGNLVRVINHHREMTVDQAAVVDVGNNHL